ncbi:MAG: hypothetical protein ACR2OK_02500, partial [Parvibaculales bacterium]
SGIEFGKTWRLGRGVFSGDRASGRQIPQPLMRHRDAPNDSQKLDGFLPDGFCVLAMPGTDKAALQNVADRFPRLACPVVALGDELTEADGLLSTMTEPLNITGFLLRPDRQIYAAFKDDGTSPSDHLATQLENLSQQILAAERA